MTIVPSAGRRTVCERTHWCKPLHTVINAFMRVESSCPKDYRLDSSTIVVRIKRPVDGIWCKHWNCSKYQPVTWNWYLKQKGLLSVVLNTLPEWSGDFSVPALKWINRYPVVTCSELRIGWWVCGGKSLSHLLSGCCVELRLQTRRNIWYILMC